mmetsp:Transcript_58576/g.109629  ORF Transcript_58576/g.109629 Transcript_58576/m.109629 type:complete len:262 (-) Transcript_58576:127-912(-)
MSRPKRGAALRFHGVVAATALIICAVARLAVAGTSIFSAFVPSTPAAKVRSALRGHETATGKVVRKAAEATEAKEAEDEEEDDDDVDDLDEIVMDDDDDDDFEADEDDEDFEDDEDDGALYEEDELDDSYFTKDEDGEVLEAVCRARHLKGSPWKFRRVLWQIRGRPYREALMLLEFMPWRACRPTLVALQSAASNAQNQFNMDKSRLYVYSAKADRGPYSKRMRPVSKGQAHPYRRRQTHLEIVVREMSDEMMMQNEEFA